MYEAQDLATLISFCVGTNFNSIRRPCQHAAELRWCAVQLVVSEASAGTGIDVSALFSPKQPAASLSLRGRLGTARAQREKRAHSAQMTGRNWAFATIGNILTDADRKGESLHCARTARYF